MTNSFSQIGPTLLGLLANVATQHHSHIVRVSISTVISHVVFQLLFVVPVPSRNRGKLRMMRRCTAHRKSLQSRSLALSSSLSIATHVSTPPLWSQLLLHADGNSNVLLSLFGFRRRRFHARLPFKGRYTLPVFTARKHGPIFVTRVHGPCSGPVRIVSTIK